MRPAFTTLKLSDRNKTVTVNGPIDLSGNEISAYFWVRVSQGTGDNEIDAVGTSEMDADAVTLAVAEVDKHVQNLVQGAVKAGPRPVGSGPASTTQEIRDVTAMWTPAACKGDKAFVKNKPVRVEAWALVLSKNPTRTFHVYWEDPRAKLT
jgi:hypothetical protein